MAHNSLRLHSLAGLTTIVIVGALSTIGLFGCEDETVPPPAVNAPSEPAVANPPETTETEVVTPTEAEGEAIPEEVIPQEIIPEDETDIPEDTTAEIAEDTEIEPEPEVADETPTMTPEQVAARRAAYEGRRARIVEQQLAAARASCGTSHTSCMQQGCAAACREGASANGCELCRSVCNRQRAGCAAATAAQ